MTAGRNPAISRAVLAVAVVAVAWLVGRMPPLALLESRLEDIRIAWLAPAAPLDPRIVVVAVDEAALARLPVRSPIDRAYLARVLRVVTSGAPRAIGLDVVLDRPTSPAADAELGAALRQSRAPVVLAGEGASTRVLPAFTGPGIAVADARLRVDGADDVVRRLPTGMQLDGSFAARLAGQRNGRTVDERRIAYALRADGGPAFPVVSSDALLNGKVDPALLAGRTVLIGAILADADRHQVPVSSHDLFANGMPGVLIHAYQVRTLLGTSPPRGAGAASLAFALVAALAALWLWRGARRDAGSIVARVALIGAMLPALLVAALLVFRWTGLQVSLTWTTLAFLLAFLAGAVLAQRRAGEQLEGAVRQFGRYVSPQAAELLAAADEDETPARPIHAAVLVTDLEDFSGLVEAHGPDAIKPLLDGYLDVITACVAMHEGAIDKIVGDGVHAWFEEREGLPEAARRAGRSALAIERSVAAFAARHPELGPRRTRIGVAAGEALLGSFGTGDRLDFTLHGKVVHVAARLEQANKQFGTTTCVTDSIARACRDDARWRDLGETALRGLDGLFRVFTAEPGETNA